MEQQSYFKVFYKETYLGLWCAHSKFEAIDKAYCKLRETQTAVDRQLIKIKK